mgnify:CR=1 FL=1
MSAQNDTQAAFMEAMNGLKEYAKVNGGFITKDDVLSYFKDLDLDDGKLQMVYGYLMANNIKIKGAASEDNGNRGSGRNPEAGSRGNHAGRTGGCETA